MNYKLIDEWNVRQAVLKKNWIITYIKSKQWRNNEHIDKKLYEVFT